MMRGFYYRLAVLGLIMAGISFCILCVAIIPSYFLAATKDSIADSKLTAQKNDPVPVPDQQTLATIKDLNAKLAVVEKNEKNTFTVSSRVINDILLKKTPGVKITDISYEDASLSDASQGKKISIEGTAPSRDVLLSFRQALGDDANFKSVDLPISNFIKGSNIQFYLSVIPS